MNFKLDKIPLRLRRMLPLAGKFGIADDWAREELVKKSSREELRELKGDVDENEDALDAWLAGPESSGPDYSDEYIAFSAMRMAADLLSRDGQ
ncbi:hypothetical protein ACN9MY_07495 [Pseudoduganella sp. R-31]|uniref:hypothetical protein n=1 Tax=Pseudoduganella sp. R-31 TaxID=3404060 RepID=UPI003CE76B6B